MFSGAFMYGVTQGMSFQDAGDLASLASATVVSEFGPRLTPTQHQEILAKFLSSRLS
jgi:sugar/nucleoside kinase (ribokinase family)